MDSTRSARQNSAGARQCPDCRTANSRRAAYCRRCGLPLRRKRSDTIQSQRVARTSRSVRDRVRCPHCSGLNNTESTYCRYCGRVMPDAPRSKSRPRSRPAKNVHRETPVNWDVGSSGNWLRSLQRSPADMLVAGGAALGLLGCFVPLVQSDAGAVSLIPHIASYWQHAIVAPVAWLILFGLAGSLDQRGAQVKRVFAGACIAVSSPTIVLMTLFIFSLQVLAQRVAFLGFHASPGAGAVMILLGAGCLMVGGFRLLWSADSG